MPLLGRLLTFILLVLSVLQGCSKSNDCPSVSEDQKDSFMPAAREFPIEVTADDQFDDLERISIAAAVSEWNELGQKLVHTDLFTVRFGSFSESLRSLDPHSCISELGNAKSLMLIRETSDDHWKEVGFAVNSPASTVRCYEDGQLKRQIMYLNPRLVQDGLLDQAFAHEFGHALGLDHSCRTSGGTASFVGCDSLKDPSYRAAVMYPWLKYTQKILIQAPDSPHVADVLGKNDEDRASCVLSSP